MSRYNFLKGIFVGSGIVIGLMVLAYFAIPEIYLFTENRNFANLREKTKLNCLTMPLHCLVRDENNEEISKYINSGKNLELKDNWGRTALFFALWNAKPNIVSKLLVSGADANTKDENEESIFYQAIAWDMYDIADQLLESGANIDIFNGSQYSETALHYCVMKNKPECVKFLISRGANKNLKDSFGYTVYERVQMHSHLDKNIGKLFEK